jgi:hypothetical protein
MPALDGAANWVRYLSSSWSSKEKRRKLGFAFTLWWQVWKERNHSIFEDREASIPQVVSFLKEKIRLYDLMHPNHTIYPAWFASKKQVAVVFWVLPRGSGVSSVVMGVNRQ